MYCKECRLSPILTVPGSTPYFCLGCESKLIDQGVYKQADFTENLLNRCTQCDNLFGKTKLSYKCGCCGLSNYCSFDCCNEHEIDEGYYEDEEEDE